MAGPEEHFGYNFGCSIDRLKVVALGFVLFLLHTCRAMTVFLCISACMPNQRKNSEGKKVACYKEVSEGSTYMCFSSRTRRSGVVCVYAEVERRGKNRGQVLVPRLDPIFPTLGK